MAVAARPGVVSWAFATTSRRPPNPKISKHAIFLVTMAYFGNMNHIPYLPFTICFVAKSFTCDANYYCRWMESWRLPEAADRPFSDSAIWLETSSWPRTYDINDIHILIINWFHNHTDDSDIPVSVPVTSSQPTLADCPWRLGHVIPAVINPDQSRPYRSVT